jgi:hypothetical protein
MEVQIKTFELRGYVARRARGGHGCRPQQGHTPPHDYAETREAAMAAFAKLWRRG